MPPTRVDGRFPIVYVTAGQLRETARLLASFADRLGGQQCESEGVVYWFGLELEARAVVTTLVVPNADTTSGSVRTSVAANAEAMEVMIGTPLLLLGQAHSHPGRFVRHSRVDDADTFAQFPGAVSVVIPFFGREGMELDQCGVHRHMEGGFQWIGATNVEQHLRVLPDVADFRRSGGEVGDVR